MHFTALAPGGSSRPMTALNLALLTHVTLCSLFVLAGDTRTVEMAVTVEKELGRGRPALAALVTEFFWHLLVGHFKGQ